MTRFEWSPPYEFVVYVGAGVALLALIVLAYRLAKSPTARRWPLIVVRVFVLAALVGLLLNPVRVREERLPPRRPGVVYLVDCSRSMALDSPISRLEQVKAVLDESNQSLQAPTSPRIALYRFGQELAAVDDVQQLTPDDDATQLREGLERLPSLFEEDIPKSIVVFSDGRATENGNDEEIAAAYRGLKIPIHVFPVGDPAASRDVAVQDVIAPRDALPGARVPVRVVLRSLGYNNERAEIRIRSLTDPQRKPLASLGVTLKGGQQQHELLIDHDPAAGKLVVEVPPLEGEVTTENNRVPFQIGGARRKIRVIYMEGSIVPYDEYHWLRDALIEDPNIECLAIVPDNQYVARPRLHRVSDPSRGYPSTREELFTYDVIICSDINRTAFTQQQLDWTVELVAKRGGGFAMVGGNTSFGSGFWDQTVWNEMIPVDLGGDGSGQGRGFVSGMPFRVRVPREAERHPIWRIVDDPVKNRRILNQMPAFSGTNFIERLKPAATALGYSDRPLSNRGVMPIFSCESFGRGRSFAMSTDTTVEWGRYFESTWGEPGDNRYFRKFWRNVIYWLSENSSGGSRRLRIDTDKVVYHPGQPIKISASAFDDKLEATDRYRLVARLRPTAPENQATGRSQIQEISLINQASDAVYIGELSTPSLRALPAPAAEGGAPLRTAVLEVDAYDHDQHVAQGLLDLQVLDDPVEFQDPRPDPERLEQLARGSGGKMLHTAAELTQLVSSYQTSPGEVVVHRSPLWDTPALWFLLVALLTMEWLLRRTWGLA
jgi:uncharacterized membrane protein